MGILDKLKNKLQTKEGKIIALFVLVEFCLWIPILVLSVEPFYTPNILVSCWLKIIAIVLLPISAFLLKKNEIFVAGLIATIGADTFLSYLRLLNKNLNSKVPGYAFFLAVQIILAIYLYVISKNKKQQLIATAVRVVLMIILPILAKFVLKSNDPAIYIMAVYIANIVLNIICAGLNKNYLMMVGFIVYLISDVFVGLPVLVKSVSFPFSFSWLLYLPANVILIFSEKTGSYFFPVAKNENKEYSN